MGCLPVLCESLAIAGFAMSTLNYAFTPAFMLGLTLAPVGSGHVLPTLQALKGRKLGPMPRNMFVAVPLEVVTTLCTFGIMQGFAIPNNNQPIGAAIGLGIIFKIVGTVLVAALIAFVFAQLADNRAEIKIREKPVFTGTVNEELLVLIAAVLVTYVLCSDQPVCRLFFSFFFFYIYIYIYI
jgi:hypothetical protein